MHTTKISPKLSWLEPYMVLAETLLPEGKQITRISAWSITNKKQGQGCVACIFTDDWIDYRIYLHTHRHPRYLKVPVLNSRIDILSNLAHELAHTLDMDHSPEHKMLENDLLNLFMSYLKGTGYVNEETELEELNEYTR